jgi:hypothetical protein
MRLAIRRKAELLGHPEPPAERSAAFHITAPQVHLHSLELRHTRTLPREGFGPPGHLATGDKPPAKRNHRLLDQSVHTLQPALSAVMRSPANPNASATAKSAIELAARLPTDLSFPGRRRPSRAFTAQLDQQHPA